MDERQQQIRERAGLEESRLNLEFIDWLRRWTTPFLLVVAVLALGYVVYQRVQQSRLERIDMAFVELEAATSATPPNPRALEDIARMYSGVRAVPHIARLGAADEYLRAARVGIAPGAELQPDGTFDESDLLSEEQQERYLREAERLYRQVFDETRTSPNMTIHTIGAGYGLAAVAEMRGDLEAARGHYERVESISESAGYTSHAAVARKRIANLPRLAERQRLYAAAELPSLPGVEEPQPELPFNIDFETLSPPEEVETGGDPLGPLMPGELTPPAEQPGEEPRPESPADPG